MGLGNDTPGVTTTGSTVTSKVVLLVLSTDTDGLLHTEGGRGQGRGHIRSARGVQAVGNTGRQTQQQQQQRYKRP